MSYIQRKRGSASASLLQAYLNGNFYVHAVIYITFILHSLKTSDNVLLKHKSDNTCHFFFKSKTDLMGNKIIEIHS